MKSLYTYFIIGLMAFSSLAAQAKGNPSHWVSITQNRTAIKGDKLIIDFDMDVNNHHIRSKQGLILAPLLQQGKIIESMPEVIINGHDRNISYKRTSDKHTTTPYAVIKSKKRFNTTITYKMEMPLAAWMVGAKLWIRDDRQSCLVVEKNIGAQMVCRDVNFGTNPLPLALNWIAPGAEKCTDSLSLTLFFPEDVTQISPTYMTNAKTLEQTNTLFTNPNARITQIKVVGAASPEGSYDLNIKLSQDRAIALDAFLENNYHVIAGSEKVNWTGEDWASLAKMVAASDMKSKEKVLAVINNNSNPVLKHEELEKLEGGAPYKYMLNKMFPMLRKVDYTIYYRDGANSIAKAREMIESSPDSLCIQEMMVVAWSYPLGSKEFNEAVLLTANTHPNSNVANLNASSVMLDQGDAQAAKQYLDKIENMPQALNNIGVMELLMGNHKQAVESLKQAAENGNTQALENLTTLNAK